jgi:hypothetical protein
MNTYIESWFSVIEGMNTSSTYKLAWGRAIIEICSLSELGNNENIKISFDEISEYVLKYYWDQTYFLKVYQGPAKTKPLIQQIVEELIIEYQKKSKSYDPVLFAKVIPVLHEDAKWYRGVIKKISAAIKVDVCWRFTRIDKVDIPLYVLERERNLVILSGEQVELIRAHAILLTQLINFHWAYLLENYNISSRIASRISKLKDESDLRNSLAKFRSDLLRLFFDGKLSNTLTEELDGRMIIDIDSLTPWSFMFHGEILKHALVSRSKNSSPTHKNNDHGSIKTSESTILLEKSSRVHTEKENLKDSKSMIRLNDEIVKRIVGKVGESGHISSNDLYQTFRKELVEHEIVSPKMLREYFQIFHFDIFDFSSVYQAFSLRKQKTDWNEVIIKIIREKGEPISISYIKDIYPNISDLHLRKLVSKNKEIISWGNEKLYARSLISISRSEKVILWNIVQEEKVIRTSKLLYLIIERFPHVIAENHLINEESLIHFLKIVYPDMFDYKQRGTVIYFLK